MALFDKNGVNVLEFLIDSFKRRFKDAKKTNSDIRDILEKYSGMELRLTKSQYLGTFKFLFFFKFFIDVKKQYHEKQRGEVDD